MFDYRCLKNDVQKLLKNNHLSLLVELLSALVDILSVNSSINYETTVYEL